MKAPRPPKPPDDADRLASEGALPDPSEGLTRVVRSRASDRPDTRTERTERAGGALLAEEEEGEADAWRDPLSLVPACGPALPARVLPPRLAGIVAAVSHAVQVPAEGVLGFALGVLASAAQRAFHVHSNGYDVPLTLFVAVVLPPGARKTSALGALSRALEAWELREAGELEAGRRQAAAEREVAELRVKHLGGVLAKAGGSDRRKLELEHEEAVRYLGEIEVPSVPRLFTGNATPEALEVGLREQAGAFAVVSDEGGSLVTNTRASRDRAPNLDSLLQGYEGGTLRLDRVGRGVVTIPHARLTLCVGLQPRALRSLRGSPELEGRGLLQRFAFVLPASTVGRRDMDADPKVPRAEAEAWAALLDGVLSAAGPKPLGETRALSLSPAAVELWRTWLRELEPTRSEEAMPVEAVREAACKLEGLSLRLAGLLHLAEHGATGAAAIEVETARRAVVLAGWFFEHARVAFGVMGADDGLELSRRVLAWIGREGRQSFTEREGYKPLEVEADAFRGALQVLEAHGYIRRIEVPRPTAAGRKPSPSWAVNPAALRRRA